MKLMIQIPCYNEAETLRTALDALPKQIEGIDTIEYLIIDDGSEDETAETARAWGVDYVVHFRSNRGLAKGFMAGLDACLRNGADIIVNTDADNQYEGADIEKLVRPIIEGRSDIVIGARPIDEIEDFSPLKKKLQHFGSFIVRKASRTTIPDAPSGFRAYSRDAAMRLNVTNEYTYTLETIVQAGRTKKAMDWVAVRKNKAIRPSRLMKSMMGYIKKSVLTIGHVFMMYKPLHFFVTIGIIIFLCGTAVGMRFLVCYFHGVGSGHVQSLILAAVLLLLGFQTIIVGLLADVIASNRKILEDVQYHVRRMDYDGVRLSKEKQESKEEEPKKENIEKAKPKKENIERGRAEKRKHRKRSTAKKAKLQKSKKAKNKKSEIAKKQKSKKAEAEKQKSPK